MPRRREFGISDYLLTLVIALLVGLVILRKWKRDRIAKRAEIRKLLRLAEEEAARVEAEAVVEYTYSAVVTPHQCAVCFSPTTTRCSRCKAIRYCSGKCQIIHWRQGHKYDCQPPDIDDSDAFVPSISIKKSEVNLNSSYEQQETEPYESNLQEPRSSTPIIKKLDEHAEPRISAPTVEKLDEHAEPRISAPTVEKLDDKIIEKHIFTAVKGHQASGLKINSGTIVERPSVDDAIRKVLEFSVQSSISSSVHIAPSKDVPIAGVPTSENSVSDISINCSEHSSSTLRSDAPSATSVTIDISKNEIPMSDVSSSCAVNNVSSSKVSTTNLPILKNDRSHLPVSDVSLGNPSGSSRFEHDLRSPTHQTDDFPVSKNESYLPSAGNHSSISKGRVNDQQTSKTVCYSSSSNGHEVDACYPLNQFSSTSSYVVDANRSLSNGHVADGSIPLNQSCSTNKCDTPTTRSSGKNNSGSGASPISSSSQKHSVSMVPSSKSSLSSKDGSLSSTCSDSQGHLLNDLNNIIAAPNIDSIRTSDSNGANRRSVRTVFQHSLSLKERVSARSIPRQKSGGYDAISSNAFQSVVSSLPTSNTLKASVKRVAQQLKSSKVSKQISTRTSNEGPGKSTKPLVCQILFPYESFVKLFNWDKLDLPPCGLINCGNSCYANTVLQCLMFTRPIAAYLLQGSHSKNCQKSDWCFMCELENLVAKVREGKTPISPIRILSKIQNIGNHLGYGREEDAHEFLRFAIDTMQSACLAEVSGERAVDPRSQETTLIQQIFGGYLQSKIKCLKCQHISERYEKMMDLTVEIEGNIESLQDALGKFTAPEILDGSNKYKCDRCKCYVKARKQLTVHEAPNILTIALKRFQSGKFGKLNKRVIFPEVLSMKPYMSGMGDKPPSYKLYAVVVHLDMMNASFSGHYVCYVKNLQGAWYKIDDSKAKQVDLDRVLAQGAYMLLYSRSSPRPPAVAKNGMAHSLTTVNVIPYTKAAKQPILNSGHGGVGVLDRQYPSMASCTVNFEDYGFDCNGTSITGSGSIGYRDYLDLTSSDSGSLFSCSDETSCSTESNRDSTSTDDFAETIFGDLGQLASSGLAEDAYTMSNSNCYMKSSPSSLQTGYYFENDAYILDSVFPNQRFCDDIYQETKKIGPELSPPSNPLPRDIDGLPDSLSKSASSYLFPPPFPTSHVGTSYFDPNLCSRRSDQLDFRTSNKNNHADFLQFHNSVGVPDISDTRAYSSSGNFATPAKSQHEKEKYPASFLQEAYMLNFDVTSRSLNSASNFDYCLGHDTRTSDSTTAESFGLDR